MSVVQVKVIYSFSNIVFIFIYLYIGPFRIKSTFTFGTSSISWANTAYSKTVVGLIRLLTHYSHCVFNEFCSTCRVLTVSTGQTVTAAQKLSEATQEIQCPQVWTIGGLTGRTHGCVVADTWELVGFWTHRSQKCLKRGQKGPQGKVLSCGAPML